MSWLWDNPFSYLVSRTWNAARGSHGLTILYLALAAGAQAAALAQPLILQSFYNTLQEYGVNAGTQSKLLWLLFAWSFGVLLVYWAQHVPSNYLQARTAFLSRLNFREVMLRGIISLAPRWHLTHESGNTYDKTEKGAGTIFGFTAASGGYVASFMELAVAIGILFYCDWTAALVVIGLGSLSLAFIAFIDHRVLSKMYKSLNLMDNDITAAMTGFLSNWLSVIALGMENALVASVIKRVRAPFRLFLRMTIVTDVKWFVVSFFMALTTFIVLYLQVRNAWGTIPLLGTFYLVLDATGRVNGQISNFAHLYGAIVQQREALRNAELISDEFRPRVCPALPEAQRAWQSMRVFGVNFRYTTAEGRERELSDAAIEWRRGEKIAFVGASGSGKTTILSVLAGLFTPESGVLEADGVACIPGIAALESVAGLVPQQPQLARDTVWENMCHAAYERGLPPSEELFDRYARITCFDRVLKRRDEGWQTMVEEGGASLSGGQRQRLSLARGLLAHSDKEILLLDEPTASVDVEIEQEIFRRLFAEYREKTVIASIHRLHLLSLFDRVYVFADGRVVAEGTCGELIQKSPQFLDLWQAYLHTSPAAAAPPPSVPAA